MTLKTLIKSKEDINEHLQSFYSLFKKELKYENKILYLDLDLIFNWDYSLYESILSSPNTYIPIFIGFFNNIFPNLKEVRLFNFSNNLIIKDIRVENINNLIATKGIIKRVTKVISRVVSISYECPSCGTIIKIEQHHKKKITPSRCSCGRKGAFNPILEEMKNIQELNLEEIPEELEGRQPCQIRVYLTDGLTEENYYNRLQPGKKIQIIGVIKPLPAFMNIHDEILNLSDFMIEANNIISLEEEEDISISEEDLNIINEIACDNPLENLASSLSSGIYGHEIIKKAIILQLAKGVKKTRPDGTFTRGDIHILLVGDPGQAKSLMLQSVILRTPKSRYVSGTRSSAVGITAIVKKDELLGNWSVEAGAIVLANKSLLCLDEADKIDPVNLSALYEPLESQKVTINKGGISASLLAETSLLASANPKHGSFVLDQPIPNQINLPSPLLNRFDLIFPILDKRNKDYDEFAVTHVFKIHQGVLNKNQDKIDTKTFKKYIAYVRKIKPILKDEVLQEILNLYHKVRDNTADKGIPINLRNVEGIIRLSEASAKIRLSEFVEIQDFKVASEIYLYSLSKTIYDESTKTYDLSRITEKLPSSRRGKIDILNNLLYKLSKDTNNSIPYKLILDSLKPQDFETYEISIILEELKKGGIIFEPTQGIYSIIL